MAHTKHKRPPALPRPRVERTPTRPLVAVVFVVTVVAATLERWWFGRAWNEAGSLWSTFYYGDASRLVDYAVAILQGRSFDNGIPFHPPGWPLVLAGFLKVTGAEKGADVVVPVAAVKLFIASLSGLTVGCAALLAGEMVGLEAMLAVALLGTFHFGHIVEGTVANSEALYGLLLVLALWTAWRWLRHESGHRILWAALAGAIGGCALLVRAEFLACAVVLVVMAWWIDGARLTGSRYGIAAFVLACGVVLAPTTIWHWRTLSAFNASHVGRVAGPLPRFAPVTSYGPFNFAIANHEFADGGPNRDHPLLDQCSQAIDSRLSSGELDLSCPAVYDLYVHGYAIGARWLLTDPAAALTLLTSKVEMMAGFLSHGYLIDDVGPDVDGTRRRVDLVDPQRWWLLPIHLALLAGGVGVLRRQSVALAVLASALAALVGSTVLFYGYVRLGVAYLPAIWIFQGAALGAAVRGVARRQGDRRLAAAAGAIGLLLLACDGAHVRTPRPLALDGKRTPTGALNQDEAVEIRRPAGS